MKKVTLFFATLLAGLLMGVNAWGADETNLGFFNFTDAASATQTSTVNPNVQVSVVPADGELQTGTSTYSLDETTLGNLNTNVGLTDEGFNNTDAQTWIGSQKGAGMHLNITISGLTPENAYNISLVSGLDWEQAGNWNSIVTENTYGSSDPELGVDKKNMSPFKLIPFVITDVIANENGEIVLQVYSTNGSHSCVINCLSIYGAVQNPGPLKTGIYRIKNEYNGRGELVYNEEYANPQLNNITLGSYDVNNVEPTGDGTYWYVKLYDEKVYIFNVEARKFLQNDNNKVVYSEMANDQTAFTADTLSENEVTYIRFISPAKSDLFLSTSCGWEPGENQVQFRTHEAASDYLTLIADSGETMKKYAEQVEMANNLIKGLVTITYNYTFNGDSVGTETFLLPEGSERPAATSIPYACEGDYSEVPDYVYESGVYVVPVTATEEFPLVFSEDYENAKWYTIEMRSGFGGCNGTNFPETQLEEQPTEAKYLFAFQGTPYAFQVLLPNGQYMINKGANNEKSTFGEEGSNFSIIACNESVTFTVNGKSGTINDVQQSIGFWAAQGAYTDAGSQMDIQPVEEIMAYKVVFSEGAPAAGGAIYDGEIELSATSRFNAVASYDALTADDLEGVEVEGYTVAVTLEGRVFTVTYTAERSKAWLELKALIDEATEMTMPEGPWGTDPGYYNQDAVEAFPDAIDTAYGVLEEGETDEEFRQATADLRAAIKAIQPIMPAVGKIYMWVNAKKNAEGQPIWQTQQGVDKVAYSTGTHLRWHTLDRGDLSNFWVVKAVSNDTVVFQNVMDGKYPKGFTTANQPIPMDTAVNGCKLIALGDAEFGIRSVGSPKSMHSGQYNDGNAIDGDMQIWDTPKDGYSAWYIQECNEFDIVFWGEYNTLIVPFDAEIPGGLEVFSCATTSGAATLELESVATIEANTPYIVRGTPDETVTLPITNLDIVAQPVTEGLLTGVFVPDSIPVGGYFFINEEGYDCFMKRTEDLSGEETPMVTGGHCFIRDLGCPAEALYFDPALAIKNLDANANANANAIFNLAGQKMNKIQKGINIVDGKKVIY